MSLEYSDIKSLSFLTLPSLTIKLLIKYSICYIYKREENHCNCRTKLLMCLFYIN